MSIIFDLSTYVTTSMISTGTRAVNGQDHAIERDFKLITLQNQWWAEERNPLNS